MRRFWIVFLATGLLPFMANAQITEKAYRSFEVVQSVLLPASSADVWEAATGDISGWWDHSFSEAPARFFIDAKPGGGFFEYFDVSGASGVQHARVIFADPEKRLTMVGPLGFNGHALHLVINWTFEEIDESQTRLRLKVSASGLYEEGWAEALDTVWTHFLDERLKGYLEAGCRGGAPCAAFE